MAFVARRFRGKKQDIVERSLRGERPEDIAVAVPTTVPYVYNVRWEARRLGFEFPQTAPAIRDPVNRAGEVDQAALQNQPAIAMHDAGNLNQTETIDQDNADVHGRIRELQQRAQRRELLAKEEHLKAVEEEDQLRTLVADITRDPSELLKNPDKYVQAMKQIVRTQPWQDKFRTVADLSLDERLGIMILRNHVKLTAECKRLDPESPIRNLVNDFFDFAANFEVQAALNDGLVRTQLGLWKR